MASRAVALLTTLGLAAASVGAAVASAHQSGCHSAHSCPSDHHTYVWYDAAGQGWSCARPGADEYDPSRDTTLITYDALPYYCYAVGAPIPPPAPAPQPTPAPPDQPPVYAGRFSTGTFAWPDQSKPRELHPFSADDNAYLYGLRWTDWGAAKAHGSGKAAANDCDPYCAAGTFVRSRGARATLYRRREGRCDGDNARFYTRALLRWPRKLHIRAFTVKLRTGCQDGR